MKAKAKVSAAEIHLVLYTKQSEALGRLFLIGADPDAIYRGVTPLGYAVSSLDIKTAQILLKAGADPNLRSRGPNDRLEPPLYTACRLRANDLVDLLLQRGADVNKTDFYGHTPLWVATKEQRPLLVMTLLKAGASLRSVEPDRDLYQCPLYLATKYIGYRGRHQLARFLLAAGADPTLMDSKGRSSLYWTLKNRDYDLFQLMIDTHNPSCWTALLQPRAESLISELPQDQIQFIQGQLFPMPSLAKQCRTVIRKCMLTRNGYQSLYNLVPLLPVPGSLKRFLLFNEELPVVESVPCFMK